MASFSSFDQLLSFAGGKIADMSTELKHHDKLPQSEFKTMTTELKKTQKTLKQALKGKGVPDFDHKLLKSIMSYINNIKKTTMGSVWAVQKRTQKIIFLDALSDFQTVLKDLQKKKKSGLTLAIKVKAQPVVKIQGIQRKGVSLDKDLDKHLSVTKIKLATLHKEVSKGQKKGQFHINTSQFKELTTVLKKANLALVKAKAMHKQFSGQYLPDYNRKTMKKILQEINFIQNKMDIQVRTGTAQMQSNLFWYTLREFQTLLQDLEALKKTRGKAVAQVETDLTSP